jgi:hypothetical protein
MSMEASGEVPSKFHYVVTAQESTAISHALVGRFTSDEEKSLNLLLVYVPDQACCCGYCLFR